jgi:hypothetical protein
MAIENLATPAKARRTLQTVPHEVVSKMIDDDVEE